MVETWAAVRILNARDAGVIRIANSWALVYENKMNPNPLRRNRVSKMLAGFDKPVRCSGVVFKRAAELRDAGVPDLDALHLAFAEVVNASHFVTCDDELVEFAEKLELKTKIVDPIAFVKEMSI